MGESLVSTTIGESPLDRIFGLAEYSVSQVIRTMQLADWLKETKTRKFRFAERIGVPASVVTDYCKGRYRPRPEVADAIVRETGGRVTHQDIYSAESPEASAQ